MRTYKRMLTQKVVLCSCTPTITHAHTRTHPHTHAHTLTYTRTHTHIHALTHRHLAHFYPWQVPTLIRLLQLQPRLPCQAVLVLLQVCVRVCVPVYVCDCVCDCVHMIRTIVVRHYSVLVHTQFDGVRASVCPCLSVWQQARAIPCNMCERANKCRKHSDKQKV